MGQTGGVVAHVAQLTDCHVQPPGERSDVGIDSNAALARAVARLDELAPRPDAVVLTGDLTDHGTPEEFGELLRLLEPIDVPVLPVAGNHDERVGLAAAFADFEGTGPEPFWQWVVDVGPVRLVALDTTIDGRHDGELDATRLRWLDEALLDEPDRPTIVCMHHPPFETGIWWMDAGALRVGGGELRELVGGHPQVRRIICGHHHRSIVTGWGSTTVSVAPSTSHQVHFDLEPESPARFTEEPAGFHVHRCLDDGDVVTHVVPVASPEGVVDLGGVFGGWDRFRDALRSGRPMRKSSSA